VEIKGLFRQNMVDMKVFMEEECVCVVIKHILTKVEKGGESMSKRNLESAGVWLDNIIDRYDKLSKEEVIRMLVYFCREMQKHCKGYQKEFWRNRSRLLWKINKGRTLTKQDFNFSVNGTGEKTKMIGKDLLNSGIVGLLKDRNDIKDSVTYARNLGDSAFTKPSRQKNKEKELKP